MAGAFLDNVVFLGAGEGEAAVVFLRAAFFALVVFLAEAALLGLCELVLVVAFFSAAVFFFSAAVFFVEAGFLAAPAFFTGALFVADEAARGALFRTAVFFVDEDFFAVLVDFLAEVAVFFLEAMCPRHLPKAMLAQES